MAKHHLVEDQVLDGISVQDAVALLARLSSDQAEAVALRVIAGLETPDVARILGKSAGAVRIALHRGLKTLAEDPAVRALAARTSGADQQRRGAPEPGSKPQTQPFRAVEEVD